MYQRFETQQNFAMKACLLLVLIGFAAYFEVANARMSAFACADCYSYNDGPFCISNGSVVCDNCKKDAMLCENTALTSYDCSEPCDEDVNNQASNPYSQASDDSSNQDQTSGCTK